MTTCTTRQIRQISYKGRNIAYGIQMPPADFPTNQIDVTIYGYTKKIKQLANGSFDLDWDQIPEDDKVKVQLLVEDDVTNHLNLNHCPYVHFDSQF